MTIIHKLPIRLINDPLCYPAPIPVSVPATALTDLDMLVLFLEDEHDNGRTGRSPLSSSASLPQLVVCRGLRLLCGLLLLLGLVGVVLPLTVLEMLICSNLSTSLIVTASWACGVALVYAGVGPLLNGMDMAEGGNCRCNDD